MSGTSSGEDMGKHKAMYSTTTPRNQEWEDITAESQAVQPERN